MVNVASSSSSPQTALPSGSRRTDDDKLQDESEQDSEFDGSLEGESEDEWAEERKAMRYIAESELDDNSDSSSDAISDHQTPVLQATKPKTIGAILKARAKSQCDRKSEANDPISESDGTKPVHYGRKGRTIPRHGRPPGAAGSATDSSSDDDGLDRRPGPSRKPIPHRSSKHAPIEISSKRAVTRKRTVVEVPKLERRDPRFDPLSGAVDENLHERSYSFLKAQRQAEIEKQREDLRKAKKGGWNAAELERLEQELKRQENKQVQREKMEREKQALKQWKAAEKAKQQAGKKVFHLKKKDQKEVILADRYQHLSQDKRKLHKAMERKRKKVDGKEKKSMPMKRARSDVH